MTTAEEWRDIPGYEGLYEVSSTGEVRSVERMVNSPRGKRRVRSKILAPSTHHRGYKLVNLHREGKRKSTAVHLLVAKAFLGSQPHEGMVVAHVDGDPTNTRLDNLIWVTREVVQFLSEARLKKAA